MSICQFSSLVVGATSATRKSNTVVQTGWAKWSILSENKLALQLENQVKVFPNVYSDGDLCSCFYLLIRSFIFFIYYLLLFLRQGVSHCSPGCPSVNQTGPDSLISVFHLVIGVLGLHTCDMVSVFLYGFPGLNLVNGLVQ